MFSTKHRFEKKSNKNDRSPCDGPILPQIYFGRDLFWAWATRRKILGTSRKRIGAEQVKESLPRPNLLTAHAQDWRLATHTQNKSRVRPK